MVSRELNADLNYEQAPMSGDYQAVGVEEDDYHDGVAEDLLALEFEGDVEIDQSSIYSAAFVIPQISRSLNWHPALVALSLRTYALFVFTVVIQVVMSLMIAEASQIVDVMSGKMHLCDFGRTLDRCPGDPKCIGPGGTQLEGSRLWDFDTWNTRNFVRDSMKAVFPDQADKINDMVDPGEYGLENFWCRFACCLVFVFSKVMHFRHVNNLCKVLWFVPSKNESWVARQTNSYYSSQSGKSFARGHFRQTTRFSIAGLNQAWKCWNFVVIIGPKVCIWWSITWMGFRFLMETSSIIDQILGAVAMDFVFSIDEIIYKSLATNTSRHIMSNLCPYPVGDSSCTKLHGWRVLYFFAPRRFFMGAALFCLLTAKYYYLNCDQLDSGLWVSKPMHQPLSTIYSYENFFWSRVDAHRKPFWTMPDES